MQKIKAGVNAKKTKKAQAEYKEARAALDKEKENLIEKISFIYGKEQAHYVSMGKLWVGMPQHLLLLAMGKASNIRQSVVGMNMVTQTWYYSNKSKGSNLEVVILNNEVSSWNENA